MAAAHVAHSAPGFRRSDSPAFAPLVFPEWKSFAAIAERKFIHSRQQLSMQGEASESVIIIETGIVKLVCIDPVGSEYIVGLRSEGWLIDAASILLDQPALFSAVTLTECAVYRIPRESFLRRLEANPKLRWDLTRMICREIESGWAQQIELRRGNAQGRLNRFLSEISQSAWEQNPLDQVPLKRLEIAQLLSITPEHLSRLLRGNSKTAQE